MTRREVNIITTLRRKPHKPLAIAQEIDERVPDVLTDLHRLADRGLVSCVDGVWRLANVKAVK